MTHAKRYSGYGASIKVKVNESFVEIGGLHQDPQLFGAQAELVDVTGHDSPSDSPGKPGRREFIGGLVDSPNRTLMFYRDPDDEGQNAVRDGVSETFTFQVEHPAWDAPEQFDAVVEAANETSALEGALTLEVTLKPTGPQTPVVGP